MSQGRTDFDFSYASPGASGARPREDAPFRIAYLADLSAGSGASGIGAVSVDVDAFDGLLQRLAPRIDLELDGAPISIEIRDLDDFHPDALYARLDVFDHLRSLRKRLSDPATFAAAAAELGASAAGSQGAAVPSTTPTPGPGTPPAGAAGSEFDRLLGGAPADRPAAPAPAASASTPAQAAEKAIESLIHGIVAPHIRAATDPRLEQYLAAVDDGIAQTMRRILHHERFQATEAAWRGLELLMQRADLGEEAQLFAVDIAREQLVGDLASSGEDLTQTALHRALVDRHVRGPDGVPWAAIVADFAFGPEPQDLATLARLGAFATLAGGPVLAAARPGFLGFPSFEGAPDPNDWGALDAGPQAHIAALRASPFAAWLGLVLPRFLLRQPYGAKSDPVDAFAFEEITRPDDAGQFLWGGGGTACAALLARTFAQSGWSMQLGSVADLDDLPHHFFTDTNGDRVMTPGAETWMSDRGAERVLEFGLMPLVSYRNRNAARLMRFQSFATPLRALPGPWARG